nr:hypothetical protein [Rhodothermus marinus]
MTFERFQALIDTHRTAGHKHLFVPVFRRLGATCSRPCRPF